MDGDMETLHHVSHLMLTGATRLVEIRGSNQILLDLRSADMPPEMGSRTSDTSADEPSCSLLKTSIGWMIEVVIPLAQASLDSQQVRVWMDAESLRMHVTSSSLKTSAIAIACWLTLAGGLVVACRPRSSLVSTQDNASMPKSSSWTVDPESR